MLNEWLQVTANKTERCSCFFLIFFLTSKTSNCNDFSLFIQMKEVLPTISTSNELCWRLCSWYLVPDRKSDFSLFIQLKEVLPAISTSNELCSKLCSWYSVPDRKRREQCKFASLFWLIRNANRGEQGASACCRQPLERPLPLWGFFQSPGIEKSKSQEWNAQCGNYS